VIARLDACFAEKIALAERAGLPRDALILDPGIDFAKQRADNLRIFRELDRLAHSDRPILLPVSRKTVFGEVLSLPEPAERGAGNVAPRHGDLPRPQRPRRRAGRADDRLGPKRGLVLKRIRCSVFSVQSLAESEH